MHLNGLELHVEQTGEGSPLVMLHGLTANIESMRAEIDRLSRSRRVIAIDSRGHGRSDKPSAYTLTDHVDDVLGVMDALNLTQVELMGSSMGSYIAQGVAIRAPARVKRLVLVTPKAHGATSSSARLLAQHADELQGKSEAEVQAFMFNLVFAPTTPAPVRASMMASVQQQAQDGLMLTPEQNLAANRALEGFDFRPDLPRVTAETLVISGRHDALNPPEEGERIAQLIPGARFEVLEHSGHVPNLEEPERFFALIEAFLR
ncbi:alpha/beta fold hydrolase [Deinococcus sonorensis]